MDKKPGVSAATKMSLKHIWYARWVHPNVRFDYQVEKEWKHCPAATQTPIAVFIDCETDCKKEFFTRVLASTHVSEALGVNVERARGKAGVGSRLTPDMRLRLL
jgi:hypothetical protein